jgi:hypothetical protein
VWCWRQACVAVGRTLLEGIRQCQAVSGSVGRRRVEGGGAEGHMAGAGRGRKSICRRGPGISDEGIPQTMPVIALEPLASGERMQPCSQGQAQAQAQGEV